MRKIILATALAAALSGCATIARGSSEAFTVESTPGGAHVALSTGQVCDATPCAFAKIKRDSNFSVTITKPGYKTGTYAITHKTAGNGSAGMAGNILFGGVIGAAIDANNGATQDLVPNPLKVTLEVEAPPTPAAPAIAEAAPAGPTPPAAIVPAAAVVAATSATTASASAAAQPTTP